MSVVFLDPADPAYPQRVDELRAGLGAPNNPGLFPPHFLKATFPKIGGRIIIYDGGAGFLFPRDAARFTLRFHGAPPPPLGEHVVQYDSRRRQAYARPVVAGPGPRIGRPGAAQARQVRELQRAIWRSEEDYLYPSDIHALAFRAGTSLVAVVDGAPVGFLFGFYKKVGDELRIESQLLGVLPEYRKGGLAFKLKAAQAEQALAEGVGVVNWTVDPLQLGNAQLNFGRLRAVAYDFYPDFYAFRNELNRLPASRLSITWLVGSERVRAALNGAPGVTESLAGLPRLDPGGSMSPPPGAVKVAVEIPEDWTRLQIDQPGEAAEWRTATDRFFGEWLGYADGKYVLTGVARDAGRAYLVAERSDADLRARLGR